MPAKRVLFFSPFSEIHEHSLPEFVLMNGLIEAGWEVHVVRCTGSLNALCPSMAARGIASGDGALNKSLVCATCRHVAHHLGGARITQWTLDDFLLPADHRDAQLFVAGLTVDSWMRDLLRGIPVGKYASYEFLLTHKLHEERLPPSLLADYRIYAMNAALSSLAAQKALDEVRPIRILTYNTLYGANRVWQHVAEAQGIPCYSLHGGFDTARRYETLMMYRDDNEQVLIAQSPEAEAAVTRPCTPVAIQQAAVTLSRQIKASSVFTYSKAHEKLTPPVVRNRLGLDPERPVVLVPLSSADERFGASVLGLEALSREPQTFKNQFGWVTYLNELALRRLDLQFVVRLHPRMFPNRREGARAPAADQTLILLRNAPDNVIVNTPDDDLSLTDILQVTAAGACGTSSVGLQMAALGLPVVVHDPHLLFAYPVSLASSVATSTDGYEAAINKALATAWNPRVSLLAFRWLWFLAEGVARPVQWRDTATESSDEAPEQVRNWPSRLSSHVPFAVAHLRREVVRRPLLKSIRAYAESDQPSLADFVQVLDEELPGLHSIAQMEGSTTAEQEDRAHANALGLLAKVLGVHDGEPTSLGYQMMQYAKSRS